VLCVCVRACVCFCDFCVQHSLPGWTSRSHGLSLSIYLSIYLLSLALEFELGLEAAFGGLADKCVALQTAPFNAAHTVSMVFEDRLRERADQGPVSYYNSQNLTARSQAWGMLQTYLTKYDGPQSNFRYRRVVAERILSGSDRLELPHWFIAMYMTELDAALASPSSSSSTSTTTTTTSASASGIFSHVTTLWRVLLRHGGLAQAVHMAQQCLQKLAESQSPRARRDGWQWLGVLAEMLERLQALATSKRAAKDKVELAASLHQSLLAQLVSAGLMDKDAASKTKTKTQTAQTKDKLPVAASSFSSSSSSRSASSFYPAKSSFDIDDEEEEEEEEEKYESFGTGSSQFKSPFATSDAFQASDSGFSQSFAGSAHETSAFGFGAPSSMNGSFSGFGAPSDSEEAAPATSFGFSAPTSSETSSSAFGFSTPASEPSSSSFGFGAPAMDSETPSFGGFGAPAKETSSFDFGAGTSKASSGESSSFVSSNFSFGGSTTSDNSDAASSFSFNSSAHTTPAFSFDAPDNNNNTNAPSFSSGFAFSAETSTPAFGFSNDSSTGSGSFSFGGDSSFKF